MTEPKSGPASRSNVVSFAFLYVSLSPGKQASERVASSKVPCSESVGLCSRRSDIGNRKFGFLPILESHRNFESIYNLGGTLEKRALSGINILVPRC